MDSNNFNNTHNGFEDFEDDEMYGVSLFNEILPPNDKNVGGLYLGRVQFSQDKERLKSLNINAIVSIIEYKMTVGEGIEHMMLVAEDAEDEAISRYFEQSSEFIEKHLATTNVYVHCMMGISRSSSLVIAYLMRKWNQPFVDVVNFVRSKRRCVFPNLGFRKQLLQLQTKMELEQQTKQEK